jgi:hypothetical protein
LANLLLATIQGPPKRGSLREFVLAQLILKKEHVEVAKTKAIVQAIIHQEAGPEAWKQFFSEAFPWVESAKQIEKTDWIKRLQSEVGRGGLKITGVFDREQNIRSRMRTKIIEREDSPLVTKPRKLKLPASIPNRAHKRS